MMFERMRNAIGLILAGAVALRIAWVLLQPLMPLLVILGVLLAIYRFLMRRDR